MCAVAEDKADRQTSRIGVRIVVGDGGQACVVGEACEDGRGGGVEVRGWGKGCGGGGGGEDAGEEDAAGVDWAGLVVSVGGVVGQEAEGRNLGGSRGGGRRGRGGRRGGRC